jgi:hypothetical protein
MMSLLLILFLQVGFPQEYQDRSSAVSSDDPKGQYQLGLWCKKKGLSTEAKTHFEKSIFADPAYSPPRKELSHRKIGENWVSPEILKAVETGIHFPPREQSRRLRARGREVSQILDLFWDRKHWAVALSRIHDMTGLYTGNLNIQIQFRLLGVPATGGGYGGEGTIKLDIDELVAYAKMIDGFAKKVLSGGRVAVPPAKMTAIITHELTHCFQGDAAPQWFLEGMASYVAGDGHFVHFFRHQKVSVSTIETRVERRYVYARGWGFFEYMHTTWGAEKFRKMVSDVLVEGEPVPVVLDTLSGLDWDAFQEKERLWTKNWVETYR